MMFYHYGGNPGAQMPPGGMPQKGGLPEGESLPEGQMGRPDGQTGRPDGQKKEKPAPDGAQGNPKELPSQSVFSGI